MICTDLDNCFPNTHNYPDMKVVQEFDARVSLGVCQFSTIHSQSIYLSKSRQGTVTNYQST